MSRPAKIVMRAGIGLLAVLIVTVLVTAIGTAWRIADRPVTSVSETVAQGQLLLGACQLVLATVLAVVAGYNAWLSRRMVGTTIGERRRAQAERVSCWVVRFGPLRTETGPATGAQIEYRNSSEEPVYGMAIRVVEPGGGLSADGVWRDVVRPGENEKAWVKAELDEDRPFPPTVEMTFTDARGVDWRRRGDGVLIEDVTR